MKSLLKVCILHLRNSSGIEIDIQRIEILLENFIGVSENSLGNWSGAYKKCIMEPGVVGEILSECT